MQFDTDSELKTGQYSRLQKVGHKTERTEVSLLGLERRVLNAHPKLFSSLFRISFFSKLASVANFSLSYFSSSNHIRCPVNVFPNPALYFVQIVFPGNTLPDTEERLATPSGSISSTFLPSASRQISNPTNVFQNPALYFVKIPDPGSIFPDPMFRLFSRLIMFVIQHALLGSLRRISGSKSECKTREREEKRKITPVDRLLFSLANAGFYWLTERQYFSIFLPLSCLTPRTGGLKPA